MSRIGQRGTAPELAVRQLVRTLGLKPMSNVSALPGKPDLVFRSARKIIFVHGCFWHRHMRCRYASEPKVNVKFWKEKFLKTQARDRQAIRLLRKAGWQTLVIWSCELRRPERVLRRLAVFLCQETG